jgi:hypothetical protein
MARELVARPVVEAFVNCFAWETLGQIDALFGDLGFKFDRAAEEVAQQTSRGQRRSRAAGYLATLDLADPAAVRRSRRYCPNGKSASGKVTKGNGIRSRGSAGI